MDRQGKLSLEGRVVLSVALISILAYILSILSVKAFYIFKEWFFWSNILKEN